MEELLKSFMNDLKKDKKFRKMMKEAFKEIGQKEFDCEMNIKMEKGTMKAEISGSSIGMLVCLKRTMKSLQEKFDISDEDLEELMEHVISF